MMWNTSADSEWEAEFGSLNYVYLSSDIHMVTGLLVWYMVYYNVQKHKHVCTTKCT